MGVVDGSVLDLEGRRDGCMVYVSERECVREGGVGLCCKWIVVVLIGGTGWKLGELGW